MNNNNSLATTTGLLAAAKLASISGATASGMATATGGIGISSAVTAGVCITNVAICLPAVAAIVGVGVLISHLNKD